VKFISGLFLCNQVKNDKLIYIMSEEIRYSARGVSAGKEDVHAAIEGLDKGLYPRAFCKILPDLVGGRRALDPGLLVVDCR
jgi:hypothetical protein